MKRSLTVRTLSFVAVTVAIPAALAGCPKKAPPVEDAGAPPPPASTPEVTELAPMVDEAGADAAEGGRKWGGGQGAEKHSAVHGNFGIAEIKLLLGVFKYRRNTTLASTFFF